MKLRIIYLLLAGITVCIGISARAIKGFLPHWINLWLGDLLYAVMMYFIVAAVLIKESSKVKAVVALAICFCIELTQLYQGDWINYIRATLPGRLVLGSGFLWSDLLTYTAGVAAAYFFDSLLLYRKKTTA